MGPNSGVVAFMPNEFVLLYEQERLSRKVHCKHGGRVGAAGL